MTYAELFLRLQQFGPAALAREVVILDEETDRTVLIDRLVFNPAGWEAWGKDQAYLRISDCEDVRLSRSGVVTGSRESKGEG